MARSCRDSLWRLARAPAATLMTLTTIGLALALPAALFTLLDNAESLGSQWSGRAGMSVFLEADADSAVAEALAQQLRRRPEVGVVSVINPEAALAEFRAQSDFGPALDALTANPLPFVLAVSATAAAGDALVALAAQLEAQPGVDMARLDVEWVLRLQAIVDLLRGGVLVVGALLGLTVLLVVGNTVRLEIENRRDEILITKLVGATDAFVRRPFVLEGLWIGLAGGLLGWIAVEVALHSLDGEVAQLVQLYGDDFSLAGPGFRGFLDLLSAGGMLGVLGAWLAVAQRLRAIEPS